MGMNAASLFSALVEPGDDFEEPLPFSFVQRDFLAAIGEAPNGDAEV
jgi:hypothetical protein